jgi:hypothetical protein
LLRKGVKTVFCVSKTTFQTEGTSVEDSRIVWVHDHGCVIYTEEISTANQISSTVRRHGFSLAEPKLMPGMAAGDV